VKQCVVRRQRAVRCKAVAAPEAPTRVAVQGPIILNGQVAHSITEERLEYVHGISDYVEQQVKKRTRRASYAMTCEPSAGVSRCLHNLTQRLVSVGTTRPEACRQVLAASRFPASLRGPRLP
jgi:hypothetical protein